MIVLRQGVLIILIDRVVRMEDNTLSISACIATDGIWPKSHSLHHNHKRPRKQKL